MDIHECIRHRRSMRKYEPDPIPEEKLQKVLEAVQWSPSWENKQVWEIIVVDDPDTKAALQECVPTINPGRKAVMMAPILLAMCGRLGKSGYFKGTPTTAYGEWAMFDVGIAAQNVCLTAYAEGLGTLHLGLLDHEKAGAILGLPEDVRLYELIPLGFPAKVGKAPPRRKIEEFVHKNGFGR